MNISTHETHKLDGFITGRREKLEWINVDSPEDVVDRSIWKIKIQQYFSEV